MREAVDEVDADVAEAGGVGVLDGVEGLGGGVAAANEAELGVVEALDTDTQAIEPQRDEGG